MARLARQASKPPCSSAQGSGRLPDEAYAAAGATIAPDFTATVAGAAIVAKVQPPSDDEVARMEPSTVLVSLMQPGRNDGLPERLASRKVTALALELVPRITRAQSMDVLSSQSTVAGYKAVLVGAAELDKFLPMLTTAAGNVPPPSFRYLSRVAVLRRSRQRGGSVARSRVDVRRPRATGIESWRDLRGCGTSGARR